MQSKHAGALKPIARLVWNILVCSIAFLRNAGTCHAVLRDLIDLWEALAMFTAERAPLVGTSTSRAQGLSKLGQAAAFRQVP